MAKIKLHNPELATNSTFKNLVIETLTDDPTLAGTNSVGRLWFNNTDKVFKGGFLNTAGDATEIKEIGIDNSAGVQANTDAIAQEVTDRTNADNTLQTNIDSNSTAISTETTDRTNADNTLQTNIDSNSTAISTETTDRTNADTALDSKITDLESTVGTNIGDLTTLTTDTKDNLVNAINETDAHIDTNTTAIATETTDRTNADTTLQGNIDTLTNDVTTNYLDKTTTTAQAVTADTTFSGTVNIQGDFTVSGTTTTVNTENLKVADNIVTLNNGIGDVDPTENAGIEVDRGNAGLLTIVQWNETADQVEIDEAGEMRKVATTNYVDAAVTSANTDIDNLQTELDSTQNGAGLNTDGTYNQPSGSYYIDTSSTLAEADFFLDSQINNVATDLATETTDRSDADTALDTRITDLENTVGDNIGDLATLTTDAKDNLVNAINEVDAHIDTNSTDIATEITNRVSADNNIQTELDDTQTGAGLNADGTYTADSLTNYITAATSLMNADKLLDSELKTTNDDVSAIDTRVTNIETETKGKIGDLSTLTTDAKDNLVNAINEVDAHIDTEVTNRTTADTTLQTNIDDEASTRTTNDDALGTRIDNVNTASGLSNDTYTADSTTTYLTSATSLANADKVLDTTIKANVDNLAATTANNGANLIGYEGYTESDTNIVNPTIETAAGDLKTTLDSISSAVNTKINDIENRYVKGEVADADKSDTYTLAHNLDTTFVDVSVQVYDADEDVWRFDLVVIEVIDANVVKISLSAGDEERIRYVIQGY